MFNWYNKITEVNIIQAANFYKIDSTDIISETLAKTLKQHLGAGQKILWLVSGGSAIDIAVKTTRKLLGADVSKLSVTLADERYGRPNHKDSNWKQLIEAGFSLSGACLKPVLNGTDPQETLRQFESFLHQALEACDYSVALLGMGADGHTAGIKPGSPALDSKHLAVYYPHNDYERLTITAVGLLKLDEAILYTTGSDKQAAIRQLAQNLPIDKQPAQIIKQIPAWSVYNDLIGGKL